MSEVPVRESKAPTAWACHPSSGTTFRVLELDHPPEPHLLGRVPNDLRKSGGWNDDWIPVLERRREDG